MELGSGQSFNKTISFFLLGGISGFSLGGGGGVFIGSGVVDSQVPIMCISHGHPIFISIYTQFQRLLNHGHSIFMVSEWQRKLWYDNFERLKKYKAYNIEIFNVEDIIYSSYLEGDKPKII